MSDLITIDLDEEKLAVHRLHEAWMKAGEAKQAAIRDAIANHSNPGNNYWQDEAKARARYIVAANFVEMLEAARRS